MQYTKNEDGSYTFSTGGAEPFTVASLERATEKNEAHVSSAKALLAELRSRRHSLIEKHVVDGRDWFLLKMNRPLTDEVAILTLALGDGTLDVTKTVVLKGLVLATVQVGVVQAKNDPTPFFNPEPYLQEDGYGNMVKTTEIEQFNLEPDFSGTIAKLFDILTDMNPLIFPQKKMIEAASQQVMTSWIGSLSLNGSLSETDEQNTPPSSLGSSDNSAGDSPLLSKK